MYFLSYIDTRCIGTYLKHNLNTLQGARKNSSNRVIETKPQIYLSILKYYVIMYNTLLYVHRWIGTTIRNKEQ